MKVAWSRKVFWDNQLARYDNKIEKIRKRNLWGGWFRHSHNLTLCVELYHKSGDSTYTAVVFMEKRESSGFICGTFVARHGYLDTAVQLALEQAGFKFIDMLGQSASTAMLEAILDEGEIIITPFGRC